MTGAGAAADTPVMLCDTRMFEVERTRQAAVKELGVVDTPTDDPRFNAITKCGKGPGAACLGGCPGRQPGPALPRICWQLRACQPWFLHYLSAA